jgi:hypothetical protein
MTMAENNRPAQPRDPFDRFDEAISDPRLYEADQSRYEQLRAQLRYTPQQDEPQPQYEQAQYEQPRYEQPFAVSFERTDVLPEELPPHEAVPLFLSNYEEEHHQQLYAYEGDRRFGSGGLKKARAGRVVAGVAVVSAIAAVLALFSIDSTRNVIFNASLGGGGGGAPPSAAQLAAAVPEPAQPQRSVAAPPIAAEPTGAEVAAARRSSPNAVASSSPSRDEIAAAYQSALKGKGGAPEAAVREPSREIAALAPTAAPVVAAVPTVPAVRESAPAPREAAPVRRIDPDELAALLKRAKSLLAIGDITSARLLLERAADAQEPEAALMLAGTFDPQVQASQDLRGVAPDPEQARAWYQKAAQMGSADAKRRLGQLN